MANAKIISGKFTRAELAEITKRAQKRAQTIPTPGSKAGRREEAIMAVRECFENLKRDVQDFCHTKPTPPETIEEAFALDQESMDSLQKNQFGIPYVKELSNALKGTGVITEVNVLTNEHKAERGDYDIVLNITIIDSKNNQPVTAYIFDNHQRPTVTSFFAREGTYNIVQSILEKEARVQKLGLPESTNRLLRANIAMIERCEAANRGSEGAKVYVMEAFEKVKEKRRQEGKSTRTTGQGFEHLRT